MKRRSGFTLVELVVVVMILGILAAVAAPKLLDTSGTATDNGIRQTLAVVRDAVERFTAQNAGVFPGADAAEATFLTDLEEYIRGDFPTCPVGAENGEVRMVNTATTTGEASPTKGWTFNYSTGDFIVNSNANTASDNTINYDQL